MCFGNGKYLWVYNFSLFSKHRYGFFWNIIIYMRGGSSKTSWKMNILKKDSRKFLPPKWQVLTCSSMSEQGLDWGTKKGKTSVRSPVRATWILWKLKQERTTHLWLSLGGRMMKSFILWWKVYEDSAPKKSAVCKWIAPFKEKGDVVEPDAQQQETIHINFQEEN